MAIDIVVANDAPSTSFAALVAALATVLTPATAIVVELTVTKATPHVEKPQQFNDEDFKRWQQKMVFYLTTLNLAHILKEDCLVTAEENITMETEVAKEV